MAKPFTEVFPELSLQEDARERMAQCTVARITMNPGKDFMKIYLESDKLIHKKYIFETERAISDQLCFRIPVTVKIIEKFHLSGQYTAEKLMPIYRDSILTELKEYNIFLYNLFRQHLLSQTYLPFWNRLHCWYPVAGQTQKAAGMVSSQ